MKKYLIIVGALLCVLGAKAQNFEQVYTKSGNIYNGYISRQPTTGSHIQFISDWESVTIPLSPDVTVIHENRDFTRLSTEMQEWLMQECGIYGGLVDVGRVTTKDNAYYNVYFLNEGVGLLAFVDFGRKLVNIAYDDIQRITRTPYAEDATEGIRTVIEMNDGMVYAGQILEQYPGVAVTFVSDDRITRSLAYKDITAIRYEAINMDKPIVEQADLLDRVVMKGGMRYIGIITSRNLLAGQVVLQGQDNRINVLNTRDISAYEKMPALIEKKAEDSVEETLPPVLIDTCRREFNRFFVVKETVKEKKKTQTLTRRIVMTPLSDIVAVDPYQGDVIINFQSLVRSSKIKVMKAEAYQSAETRWSQTVYVEYPSLTDQSPVADVDYDITQEGDRTVLHATIRQNGLYVICFDDKDECIAFKVERLR